MTDRNDHAIEVRQQHGGWRWRVGQLATGPAPTRLAACRYAEITLGLIDALQRASARRV